MEPWGPVERRRTVRLLAVTAVLLTLLFACVPHEPATSVSQTGAVPQPGPTEGTAHHGRLDCTSDVVWEYSVDLVAADAPAARTSAEALIAELAPYAEASGGSISLTDADGSVLSEGSAIVRARARRVPTGGWVVDTVTGCAADISIQD